MKDFKVLVGILLVFTVPAANAAVSDEDFAAVKQMLEDAMQRIAELEASQAVVDTVQQAEIAVEAEAINETAEQVAKNTVAIESMSWAERIKLQGDFRYRYQPEETDGFEKTVEGDEGPVTSSDTSRNRQRIRARAAILAQLADDVEVGLGVATGGDDPVSANQTLGGSGSSKDIRLDLAYANWAFADNSRLYLGKFKNQFTDVPGAALLWDSDFRPEGFNVGYDGELFYGNFLGTWLESDGSSGSGSSFNYLAQVGATPELGGIKLDVGLGYSVLKAEGRQCYNAPSDGLGDNCFGNTYTLNPALDPDKPDARYYIMDYAPLELFGKASFELGVPVSLFFDYAVNTDAETIPTGPSAGKKLDTAYLVGGSLGKGKKQGEWQIKAYYQEKEADSVLGLLTDSDFAGGGTDVKGFVLKGKYMLRDSIYLQATYLDGERLDSNGYENGSQLDPANLTSNPYDVDVLQLDVQFKYK
jgi:hypothetical protein